MNRMLHDFDFYQAEALRTAIYPHQYAKIYPALKLSGEAGEVAEKVGKVLRDKEGAFSIHDRDEIAKELGDVLWYLAALASDFGLSLGQVAETNLRKLKSRQERGVLGGSGDNR